MNFNLTIVVIILVAVDIMFAGANSIVIRQNADYAKKAVEDLLKSMQRLLSNNYLITSNNALLLNNQNATILQNGILYDIVHRQINQIHNETQKALKLLELNNIEIDHLVNISNTQSKGMNLIQMYSAGGIQYHKVQAQDHKLMMAQLQKLNQAFGILTQGLTNLNTTTTSSTTPTPAPAPHPSSGESDKFPYADPLHYCASNPAAQYCIHRHPR